MASKLETHGDAVAGLNRLLNARAKETRLACSRCLGKLTRLPAGMGTQIRQLETTTAGLYVIAEASLPSREVLLFFDLAGKSGSLRFRILHAAEVMGETQFQAECRKAELIK